MESESASNPYRLYFGGSFDPPHVGHVQLPSEVLAKRGDTKGKLIYVPAARSPLKAKQPTADIHRLEMLRIALRVQPIAEIWTIELDRQGDGEPSYWYQTWEQVQHQNRPGQDRFLIGADQALSMHQWRNYQLFWRDAVVILRDDFEDAEQLLDSLNGLGVWTESELCHWRTLIVKVPMVEVSSTLIRRSLADPEQRKNPIIGLDDRVHEYILEHGLYLTSDYEV